MTITNNISFKLLDFEIGDRVETTYDDDGNENNEKMLEIKMFGLDEYGKTYCIHVDNYNPFFYIRVSDKWTMKTKNYFQEYLKKKLFLKGLIECKLIKRHKLYGFDAGKEHKFILFKFNSITEFNKTKYLWYKDTLRCKCRRIFIVTNKISMTCPFCREEQYDEKEIKEYSHRQIIPYEFNKDKLEIYESTIPPLLRFFHINEISPSGWIKIQKNKAINCNKESICDYEYSVSEKNIKSDNKETGVPYKICSFDIEASSSHGDFPVPKKNYRKLVIDILDYFNNEKELINTNNVEDNEKILRDIVLTSFNFVNKKSDIDNPYEYIPDINLVYPKKEPKFDDILELISGWLKIPVRKQNEDKEKDELSTLFEKNDDDEEENEFQKSKKYIKLKSTILDLILDDNVDREVKLNEITQTMNIFPQLKGDEVTFIGSTFWKAGEKETYLEHIACINSCSKFGNEKTVVEDFDTEKEVIISWKKLIQKENPDIIIGYNIFGFDYPFMFTRACENNVEESFLKMSRMKNEVCGNKDRKTDKWSIEKSSINIASGTHEYHFIKMTGRIQIDLLNVYRRDYNLESYKLDYVSGYFIGDKVKKFEYQDDTTIVYSKNLMGLREDAFINFDETGYSTESYADGKKFKVIHIDKQNCKFILEGKAEPNMLKSVKWGLAKDDVSPQDIFRMTKGTADDRSVIAKYCVQDCNLVHNLLIKTDIFTGFVEMAGICSVPLSFLIMRGQGIKLLSYISKKCREKRTLMPDLNKKFNDGGYEGAIVLPPKCGLYLDNPVACVDYASLYPSSMLSENLSHDSKVWTKEYDLNDELIKETGSKDYDNLPDYKYVDVKYDTFDWISKPGRIKKDKVCVGYKICRFAQFPDGKRAIMPSILEELLAARKATRTSAKFKTIKTKDNNEYTGLILKDDEEKVIIKTKEDNIEVEKRNINSMEDTFTDFMKNVLDKRQLGYKVTANSLYGQCGAITSAFYEKDVAASTTATGRKLLTYARRMVEEVYGDKICKTSYGVVHSHAEYIYGDSVTYDTPLMLKNKNTDNIEFCEIGELGNIWRDYEMFKVNDSNRREKQQSQVNDYKIWTSKGWCNINRVIRHKCNKQIYRITTHTGIVDVTEDHSLLDENGNKIKPTEVKVGEKLLNYYPEIDSENKVDFTSIEKYKVEIVDKNIEDKKAFIYGFFFGDGSCGKYNCKSGIKYSWGLNQKDLDFCLILKELLEEIYGKEFKILDTIKSSNVYKIVPSCGEIKIFVDEYRNKFYNLSKYKIVPIEILNGDSNIKEAFLAGYYSADGSKCLNEKTRCLRMCNKGKIGTAGLFYIAKSLGLNVSLNSRKDKKNIFRLTCSLNKQRKEENIIKKIDKLGYIEDFVYDIETVTGNFNTGFPLIVKNTDSVFMSFNLTDLEGNKISGKEALKITIELAKEMGELSTKYLKKPHDLEYEKTFMPFLLLSKKRYVGMLYEEDPEVCYRKSMGIVLKRRDNAPIVKDVYGGIIDILMKDQDIPMSVNFTRNILHDIVNEKFGLEKLIITKSLRGFYKNPKSIAHKVLADRIGKREPGNKPSVGDRIPYVYIQTNFPKKLKILQGDKIENPTFIKKNKIRPDYGFYITNQIMKPVTQVFALILEQIPEYSKKISILNSKIDTLSDTIDDEKKFTDKVQKLKDKEVELLIFKEFLLKTEQMKTGQTSISSFFITK
jgi:DNA polymerase elongation subunit (family B)